MKIVTHSCGNVMPLLDWLPDCGVDGVQSLEPTAGVDPAAAKELAGRHLCLAGDIDVNPGAGGFQPPKGVRCSAEGHPRRGTGDAGFILSPAHDHADVPLERLQWMVEAVHRHAGPAPPLAR